MYKYEYKYLLITGGLRCPCHFWTCLIHILSQSFTQLWFQLLIIAVYTRFVSSESIYLPQAEGNMKTGIQWHSLIGWDPRRVCDGCKRSPEYESKKFYLVFLLGAENVLQMLIFNIQKLMFAKNKNELICKRIQSKVSLCQGFLLNVKIYPWNLHFVCIQFQLIKLHLEGF